MYRAARIVLLLFLVGAAGAVIVRYRVQPQAVQPVTNQYEIRVSDSGKTFSYPVTSRFTVVLDSTQYAPQNLHCMPQGVVGSISNIPAVEPPLFAARFEAVAPGTCTLQDNGFTVKIIVEPLAQ